MLCVGDQTKSKKKRKRHDRFKKKYTIAAVPSSNDLPINAAPGSCLLYIVIAVILCILIDKNNLPTKINTTDCPIDEETTDPEFLNGYFDARLMHLFNYRDNPSSSEEEEEVEDENVYVVRIHIMVLHVYLTQEDTYVHCYSCVSLFLSCHVVLSQLSGYQACILL